MYLNFCFQRFCLKSPIQTGNDDGVDVHSTVLLMYSTRLYRGTNPVNMYETELIPAETVMANSKTNWIQWNLPKCPIDFSTLSKSKPGLLTSSSSELSLFQHFIFVSMVKRLNRVFHIFMRILEESPVFAQDFFPFLLKG